MDHSFKDLSVIREGDASGNRMVIKVETHRGNTIHAVSVPRVNFSYTGPTWAWLFENEGLTLIDAGEFGSFQELDEGLQCAGFRAKDIQRVIITHGHEDHDGSVAELVDATGAEVWAHDIYSHLQGYDPRAITRRPTSPIQEEFTRVCDAEEAYPPPSPQRDKYLERRQNLKIDHPIQPNEQLGNLTLIHAPGHSPDELCMKLDDVVFTGDHVLPEISPHPTMKTVFTPEMKNNLPERYHRESDWYGLLPYLQSLKIVSAMGEGTQALPAHRFFNRSHFNFINGLRARDIIEHHGERLGHILDTIGEETVGLEALTRGIFERRKLMGINLRAAMAEIVAHIELLEDTEDLEVTDRREVRRTGRDNYKQVVNELVS